MRSFSPRAALLATLLTTGCEEPPPPPAPAATAPSVVTPGLLAPVDIEDPAACRPCHQLIVDEWAASMHSHSHRTKDPIFDKLLALRMEKQGKEIAKKCAKCHSPRSPGDDTTRAALLGVSCATCHNVQSVHAEGKLGRDALVFDESGTLRSGRDVKEGASPAHRTGAALAELADGKSVCLACHDALQTPGGAPSCTTGPESRTNPDAPSCVSCHMREVVGRGGSADTDEKHRSHHFAGPHRAWYQLDATMLASGITLDAHFDESALAVVLKNESVHAFPTGFPGRVAVVRVQGRTRAARSSGRASRQTRWPRRPTRC